MIIKNNNIIDLECLELFKLIKNSKVIINKELKEMGEEFMRNSNNKVTKEKMNFKNKYYNNDLLKDELSIKEGKNDLKKINSLKEETGVDMDV